MSWNQSLAQQNRRRREAYASDQRITAPYKAGQNWPPPLVQNEQEKPMENPITAITTLNPQHALGEVKSLYQIVSDLYKNMLKPDLDYGVIPGTGNKPTLLLPGMEKLMRALNAVPRYIEKRVITDYDVDKPLFHYEYECQLIDADTGQFIPGGIGIGLCTSMESAFRWRKAERVCPTCGQPLRKSKGKEEYYCWTKTGGCGATFATNDPQVAGQEVGRIPNPDIFDQVNAICKRAQKRALASAVKGAAAVSEFFTVDVEDFIDAEFTPSEPGYDPTNDKPATPKKQTTPKADENKPVDGNKRGQLHGKVAKIYDNEQHRIASINKMFTDGILADEMPLEAMTAVVVHHRAKVDLNLSDEEILRRLSNQPVMEYLKNNTIESAWALFNELDDVAF